MEQQQRSLVFTAAVGLIILAIIVGSIYYLVKFIQGRVSSTQQPSQTVESVIEGSPSAQARGSQTIPNPSVSQGTVQVSPRATSAPQATPVTTVVGDKKVYNAGNFQLSYPQNWGFLTCANSENIELDPVNAADSNVSCVYATKPVTIVVDDNSGCTGEAVSLGSTQVSKSVKSEGGYTKYQWCTKTSPSLNITHRVSTNNDPASSKNDYSKQVEEMISKLTFVRGS